MHTFTAMFPQALMRSLAHWTRWVCDDASEALKRLAAPFKAPCEPAWAFAYVRGKRPRAADPLTFT